MTDPAVTELTQRFDALAKRMDERFALHEADDERRYEKAIEEIHTQFTAFRHLLWGALGAIVGLAIVAGAAGFWLAR